MAYLEPSPALKRTFRWFLGTTAALVGLAGLSVLVVYLLGGFDKLSADSFQPKNGIHFQEIGKDLYARLPPGSTREEAEAWFASWGVEPRSLGTARPIRGLAARIPNDSRLESAEIYVQLEFDEDARLTSRFLRKRTLPLFSSPMFEVYEPDADK